MEILKRTKEMLASLADVTQAGSKIARYKIEVANLDRKLGLAFKQIGERIYQLSKEQELDLLEDPEIREAFENMAVIRARMEEIHKEVKANKGKAASEWDRATKSVREETSKAGKAVKREAEKAAQLLKEESDRAKAAFRKTGKASKEEKKAEKSEEGGQESEKKPSAKKKVAGKKPAAGTKGATPKTGTAKKTAAKKQVRPPAGKATAKKAPASRKKAKK